jgi:hypothetical protein
MKAATKAWQRLKWRKWRRGESSNKRIRQAAASAIGESGGLAAKTRSAKRA